MDLDYYKTENKQYLYDSDLHPELLEKELINNYIENQWIEPLMQNITNILEKFNINKNIATHIGCSTGNLTSRLSNEFKDVNLI